MAIRIGITGGIGSGKSVVSHLLNVMGIPVYISDIEAKRLTLEDVAIRQKLIALLGEEVYIGNDLNKSLLASYIFGNPEYLETVNAIIHPSVRLDFNKWVKSCDAYPIVAIESAILVEAGFISEVDYSVMVYASQELRVSRAMHRDSSSRESVERRLSSQMDDEKKRHLVDKIIINDGESPLIPQVLDLITSLSQNIPYLCFPKK